MSMTRKEAVRYFDCIVRAEDFSSKQAEAARIALFALRPVSREQVEKVWRGEWTEETYTTQSKRGRAIHSIKNTCSACGKTNGRTKTNFCPSCGAPMTDEAVDMMLEKWKEALKND